MQIARIVIREPAADIHNRGRHPFTGARMQPQRAVYAVIRVSTVKLKLIPLASSILTNPTANRISL